MGQQPEGLGRPGQQHHVVRGQARARGHGRACAAGVGVAGQVGAGDGLENVRWRPLGQHVDCQVQGAVGDHGVAVLLQLGDVDVRAPSGRSGGQAS